MSTPAIHIDNITIQFGSRTVLKDFSLSMNPGDKVTITGRSGSGKSTVLRCVLGFVVPSEGEVNISGKKLSSSNVWKLRRQIAYVAQELLLGEGKVRDLIERPFIYKANAHLKGNLSRLDALFDTFLLSRKLLKDDISTISGGEKQRIALITAVLLDRTIFLLDEVTSALDNESREAVYNYFHFRDDFTILSVSHLQDQFCLSERIIKLNLPEVADGRD
jgi:ABC-type bacteriocin/lantibiotic exporter with double-glycine peptidase domain